MRRFVLVPLLLLAASGARGQRVYLPDGSIGGGLAGSVARASGESATGLFLIMSPIERLDVTIGAVGAPEYGSDQTMFAGAASYFFQSRGDARASASVGFQTVSGSDDVVITVGAGVAQRIEASPGVHVVPQGGATFATFSRDFDPVVVLSGGVGFSAMLGSPSSSTGPLLYVTPTITYGLDAGQIGIGGTLGGSVGF